MLLSRKFLSDYMNIDENLSFTDIAKTNAINEYDDASNLINSIKLETGESL